MKHIFSCGLLALAACTGAPPVIVEGQVFTPDGTAGFVRTNTRQTIAVGEAGASFRLIDAASGVTIKSLEVSAGSLRYVDRDLDLDETVDAGTPVPASFKTLFPVEGEAEALGIVWSE